MEKITFVLQVSTPKTLLFKILTLTVLVISSSITGFSQENYLPGYILKNNKDTVNGFVDYRDWGKNPNQIDFKEKLDGSATLFSVIDLIEFRVADKIYVSAIIETETSSFANDKLEYSPEVNIKIDTTFLQTLFRGEKSLYYYKTTENKENFYIRNDKGFELLIYKKYLTQQGEQHALTENKKFIGQLRLYLSDCNSFGSVFDNKTYKEKHLTKIFKAYGECKSSAFTYIRPVEKIKTETGAIIGPTLTSLNFKGDTFEYLVDADYETSISFTAGLFLNLVLPRNQGKWSINNEIVFSSYKVKGTHEDIQGANYAALTDLEIGYSSLKLNNMLRFKYPVNHYFIFFNAGLSNGLNFIERNYRKTDLNYYGLKTVSEDPAIEKTKKYEQGFIIGSGVNHKQYSLELRFERANGTSAYPSLSSVVNKFSLLFGYRF